MMKMLQSINFVNKRTSGEKIEYLNQTKMLLCNMHSIECKSINNEDKGIVIASLLYKNHSYAETHIHTFVRVRGFGTEKQTQTVYLNSVIENHLVYHLSGARICANSMISDLKCTQCTHTIFAHCTHRNS